MHVAVLSLSKTGSVKAAELVNCGGDINFEAYCLRTDSSIDIDYKLIKTPVFDWVEHIFNSYSAIVLIMPVGIAVRMVAPLLTSKHSDPAVISVDDVGNFAISLVSGHLGGADDLTVKIANMIQATPVITSSSAVLNKPSVDLIGSEYYWKVDSDARSVTAVSAEVINDSDIGIFQDAGETDWSETIDSHQFRRYASLEQLASSNVRAAIIITDKLIEKVIYKKLVSKMSCVIFRPPVLHIGIGCRKSTDQNEVFTFTLKIIEAHGLSKSCVASISTINLKQNDPSVKFVAKSLDVPLKIYTSDDIEQAYKQDAQQNELLTKSSNPKRLIGVWGVAEPTAILSSTHKDLIVNKHKSANATIAIAK